MKAYNRRGKAYLAIGQIERALADFEICASRDPNDPDVLECLGEACLRMDQLMRQRGELPPEEDNGSEGQETRGTTTYEVTESEASSIQSKTKTTSKEEKDTKFVQKPSIEEKLRLERLQRDIEKTRLAEQEAQKKEL